MLSGFWAIISVIKALIDAVKAFLGWRESVKQAEVQENINQREQAITDAQNAKSEEEAFNAQDRIVDSTKP